MSIAFDFLGGQSYPLQVTAVAFRWYEAAGVGDSSQPGFMAPFLQDENGALLVSLLGPAGSILLPDDADDVPESAINDRVPTVARMYALDAATGSDWDRIRTDDDSTDTSAPDGLPALKVMGRNRLFTEAFDTFQRERSIDGLAVAPSAARTVTTTFGTFINVNHRALHVILEVTVIGADDLTIEIQGRQLFPPFDFYPLLTGLAVTATGTTVYKIGIGFTPIANLTANDLIPAVWQVVATHSGADPITYSMNANLSV